MSEPGAIAAGVATSRQGAIHPSDAALDLAVVFGSAFAGARPFVACDVEVVAAYLERRHSGAIVLDDDGFVHERLGQ
jgi:hypothetical protein